MDYGKFLCLSKSHGSRLTERGFKETLGTFFYNGKTFRCELIDCFVKKLETFLQVMEQDLKSYRFYNSSLLLVYEGEVDRIVRDSSKECSVNSPYTGCSMAMNPAEQCTCTSHDQIDIRMIDFAHVSRDDITRLNPSCSADPDEEYIFGLKSLIRILQEIEEEHHRKFASRSKTNGNSLKSYSHDVPCIPK